MRTLSHPVQHRGQRGQGDCKTAAAGKREEGRKGRTGGGGGVEDVEERTREKSATPFTKFPPRKVMAMPPMASEVSLYTINKGHIIIMLGCSRPTI